MFHVCGLEFFSVSLVMFQVIWRTNQNENKMLYSLKLIYNEFLQQFCFD